MNIFANRLKEILEDKEMKQKELAELIGINEVSISRYLKGTHEPGMDILEKIANALNVSLDYLLGRSDNMSKPNQEYDPQAEEILDLLEKSEEYRILFDKVKDLSPEDIKRIAKIIDLTLNK